MNKTQTYRMDFVQTTRENINQTLEKFHVGGQVLNENDGDFIVLVIGTPQNVQNIRDFFA